MKTKEEILRLRELKNERENINNSILSNEKATTKALLDEFIKQKEEIILVTNFSINYIKIRLI